jgi:hypothetical protein
MINIPTKEIENNRDNGGREFIVGSDRVLSESFQIVGLNFLVDIILLMLFVVTAMRGYYPDNKT